MNKWRYFPISSQAAVAICNRYGFTLEAVRTDAHCLDTGAKISWNRDIGWLIYGYHFAQADTIPYRQYINKKFQHTELNGWQKSRTA